MLTPLSIAFDMKMKYDFSKIESFTRTFSLYFICKQPRFRACHISHFDFNLVAHFSIYIQFLPLYSQNNSTFITQLITDYS